MVPLCSMVPLDTQACWLMECLLLLVWPSIQHIPVEMLLWPRCQGQRGVIWFTTFFSWNWLLLLFYQICVFLWNGYDEIPSKWLGTVSAICPHLIFLENHYISIRVCKVNSNHTLCECGPWASQKVERDDWLFEAFWVKVTPCVVVSWVKVRERSEIWGWCPLTFGC